MKRFATYILIALLAATAISCNNGKRRKALMPNISGKPGEVVVVIGKDYWEGSLGNTLRDSLACDFPYLPQSEPMFDLVNVAPAGFTSMFQLHRNIIAFNIRTDVTEPGVIYKNDQWAAPQCVIKINAPTEEVATELFMTNCEKIKAVLEQAERARVISNTKKYEELNLAPVVTAMAGGSPHFPSGYKLKARKDNFIWIAYETQFTMQGILIYKYPVEAGVDMMSPEALLQAQDNMTRENVPGMRENSYMMISPIITPSVKYKKYGVHEFAEIRGLWEVYGDYMGGPFVSHAFYTPDGQNMILLQAFVYAPKYDKKNYLKQVESVLYSWEWKKE
ncbi:MAG: DUF4837 family protein [Bacteroidales bacterium]|nr:DUF4837 family protein [Bacteroidales bacterium]